MAGDGGTDIREEEKKGKDGGVWWKEYALTVCTYIEAIKYFRLDSATSRQTKEAMHPTAQDRKTLRRVLAKPTAEPFYILLNLPFFFFLSLSHTDEPTAALVVPAVAWPLKW